MVARSRAGYAGKRRFAVLAPEPRIEAAIPESGCFRTYAQATSALLDNWHNIFVLVSLTGLPRVSDFVRDANQRNRLRAVFLRREDDFDLLPQFLHFSHVRTLRNMLVHKGPEVPWRVLNAHRLGAEHELIADAQMVDDRLFLVSCASEAHELSFGRVPALRNTGTSGRRSFRVSRDGAYIHWPKDDVHLDLDSIKRLTDPDWAERRQLEELLAGSRSGRAIAAVRKAAGLRQREIPGLSERQVRRIERGEGTTLTALKSLAAAHGEALDAYLERVARAGRALRGTRMENDSS